MSDRHEPWSEPRRRGRTDDADEAFWADDRRGRSRDRRRAAEETFFGDESSDSVFDQRPAAQPATWPQEQQGWGDDPSDPYHRRAPRADPRHVQPGGPPPRPRPRQLPGDDPYRTQAYPQHQQPAATGVRRPPTQRQPQRPYPSGPRQHPIGPPDRRDAYERPPERDRRGAGPAFPLGLGSLFGVVGLIAFLLALTTLPWAKLDGQELTLADIRDLFAAAEAQPEQPEPSTDTTLAEGIPSPEDVQNAVEEGVRDAVDDAVTSAADSAKGTYLELYSETIWLVSAVALAFAVLFATVLAPKSFALGLILGFQRLGGTVTVLASIAYGIALWIALDGNSPALGVWVGVTGLVLIFVGCILGPRKA